MHSRSCYSLQIVFCLMFSSIGWLLGCRAEHGPPLGSSWVAPAIPDTEAGLLVGEYLEAFNSGDLERLEGFMRVNSTEFGPGGSSLDERVNFQKGFYNTTRGMDVYSVVQPNDAQITLVAKLRLKEQWRQMDFMFEREPKKLAGIRIIPVEAPEEPPSGRRDLRSDLDDFLNRQLKFDQFSGVVLVSQRGQTQYARALGLKSKETAEPITLETTFPYASIGKMFTAVAIAQLVESGDLEFGDLVAKRLPDIDWASAEQTTLAHLLSHQSGIPDYFENIDRFKDVADSQSVLQDYLPIFAALPLNFQPGQRFEYSNSNFLILGAIIERISGQGYEDFIQQRIFDRCAMSSTRFTPAQSTAVCYTELTESGTLTPGQRRSNRFVAGGKGSAAGGGITSAGDLLRFGKALTSGHLCSQEMVAELVKPRVNAQRPGESYGYGFMSRKCGDETIVGHSGGFPGVDAQFDWYLSSGWSVIVLSNYEAVAEPVARHVEAHLAQTSIMENKVYSDK